MFTPIGVSHNGRPHPPSLFRSSKKKKKINHMQYYQIYMETPLV